MWRRAAVVRQGGVCVCYMQNAHAVYLLAVDTTKRSGNKLIEAFISPNQIYCAVDLVQYFYSVYFTVTAQMKWLHGDTQ